MLRNSIFRRKAGEAWGRRFLEVAMSDSNMNHFPGTESVTEVGLTPHFVTAESTNLKK